MRVIMKKRSDVLNRVIEEKGKIKMVARMACDEAIGHLMDLRQAHSKQMTLCQCESTGPFSFPKKSPRERPRMLIGTGNYGLCGAVKERNVGVDFCAI